MTRDLVKGIAAKRQIAESGLRTTLSRIKRRHDLISIQQAACFYIKSHKVPMNVSSIIDQVTRDALREASRPNPPPTPPRPTSKRLKALQAPKVKWLPNRLYTLAEGLSDFYPYLFIFENALRRAIDQSMTDAHGPEWWELKIKAELPDAYRYAKDEMFRQSKLPIVGKTLKFSPLELITVGHLEQIIQKYQPLFVPSVFPTLHFFTGHMVIVKQVRNAVAHVSSVVTARDLRNARHEIDILLQQMSSL